MKRQIYILFYLWCCILMLAEKYKMYVYLRLGSYMCAEWGGGGYPQWIMKKRPAKYNGKS